MPEPIEPWEGEGDFTAVFIIPKQQASTCSPYSSILPALFYSYL